MSAIMALPSIGRESLKTKWTKEMDDALMAGRNAMKSWPGIAEVLGLSDKTIRKRYRELKNRKE